MLGRRIARLKRRFRRWRKKKEALDRTPGNVGRFVFIGGLHRSGTTILHALLRDMPDVSGLEDTGVAADEGQFLQDVFPPAAAFGGPGEFAFHEEAHMTEDSPLVTPENRDRILRQWGPYLDLSRPVYLEKSPPNLVRSRFLQALFPGSASVFLVRHPVAVSLATEKWSDRTLLELFLHWRVAHLRLLKDLDHLDRALLLRYEDFVEEPEACLRRVCEAVGVPFTPPRQEVYDANEKYFHRWREEHEGKAGLLRELGLDDGLETFGYALEPPFVGPVPEGGPVETIATGGLNTGSAPA